MFLPPSKSGIFSQPNISNLFVALLIKKKKESILINIMERYFYGNLKPFIVTISNVPLIVHKKKLKN